MPSRGDMHFYDDWARQVLHGHITDHLAFYGLPGYAYLLAFLYKICGYNPFVPGLLQALVDAATATLIYKISLRVFAPVSIRTGQMTGILAAGGWGLFVPAQTYAVVLMPTALVVFVFWLIVWCIVGKDYAPQKIESLGLGTLIGITATFIATPLFLIPLLIAAVLLKPTTKVTNTFRYRMISLALLFIGVSVGTAPCWIHNYFVARDPVFLSAHSGINLWIGNNPAATGYPRFPPGLRASQAAMLQDSITAAESAAGHPLKRGEVSQFWSAKARDYVRHDFGGWLRLLAVKMRNFWNAFQYDDLSVVTSLRENGVTFPGIYFGVIAALGLPALVIAWKMAPLSRWLSIAILLHMLALLSVFTTERYRLPIVPGLLIFSAFGMVMLGQWLANCRFMPALSYLTLLAGSAAFVSWPQRDPSLWALDVYNSGLQALDSGDLAAARQRLDRAYAYSPFNAEITFAKGNLQLAAGDTTGARDLYRSALALNPHHTGALNNLGVLALKENRWTLAADFFRHALVQSPNDAKIYYLLANAHLNSGDRETALAEIATAIRLLPDQPEFRALQQQIQVPGQNDRN
ncbi:MAG TPA: tetratricopeptide repeat protein [Chthoniobacterales bacterium]